MVKVAELVCLKSYRRLTTKAKLIVPDIALIIRTSLLPKGTLATLELIVCSFSYVVQSFNRCPCVRPNKAPFETTERWKM